MQKIRKYFEPFLRKLYYQQLLPTTPILEDLADAGPIRESLEGPKRPYYNLDFICKIKRGSNTACAPTLDYWSMLFVS